MAKILLVEDDAEMSEVLQHSLEARGYLVESAGDGREALDLLKVYKYDAIILDWMMPGVSGTDVCQHLRGAGDKTPILMLTARSSSDDKENGLDAGADDYLTKPFDNKELCARIRALLRRPDTFLGTTLTHGDLELDPKNSEVKINGKVVKLRPMLTSLLEFFLRHPNQPFTAMALLERVWRGEGAGSVGSVRAHIKLLRKAIDRPGSPSHISTHRYLGYTFLPPRNIESNS